MKAIVENVALTANLEKFNAFVCILNVINLSKNENDLRANMKHISEIISKYGFDYGFGSSHMWVSDTNIGGERVIFVEF